MECDLFQRIIDANQTELLGSIEYLCWSKKIPYCFIILLDK